MPYCTEIKHLNSSLPFGKVALKFGLPWASLSLLFYVVGQWLVLHENLLVTMTGWLFFLSPVMWCSYAFWWMLFISRRYLKTNVAFNISCKHFSVWLNQSAKNRIVNNNKYNTVWHLQLGTSTLTTVCQFFYVIHWLFLTSKLVLFFTQKVYFWCFICLLAFAGSDEEIEAQFEFVLKNIYFISRKKHILWMYCNIFSYFLRMARLTSRCGNSLLCIIKICVYVYT